VTSSGAVLVFLVFLLFAVQLLIGLYGRSVVTSSAYDGARSVAGARVDHDDPVAVASAQAAAVDRMRQQLGDVGTRATFDWTGSDPDTVVLRIQADNPRFSFPGLTGALTTDHIDRTVHARVERLR
jgi:Na+-transporting methylmalonyl-CoA/oxaloacetate decarboxylase gamma subunit